MSAHNAIVVAHVVGKLMLWKVLDFDDLFEGMKKGE